MTTWNRNKATGCWQGTSGNDFPWTWAFTLERYVVKMTLERRTEEPEFKAAMKYFGRERFRSIVKNYLASKKKDSA